MTSLSKPFLNWQNFHHVVSESNGKYRNRGDIKHWVKIAHLSNEWYVNEIFIEQFGDLARVLRSLVIASVREATERYESHNSFYC